VSVNEVFSSRSLRGQCLSAHSDAGGDLVAVQPWPPSGLSMMRRTRSECEL